MRLAVIPARGGSKRIPRKNIKLFEGKPIVAWSIEAAIQSQSFDHVIVSTDDLEIAEVARSFGASIPFLRPASLADDYTDTIPVIRHAVEWYAENGAPVKYACCIYPTAPFLTSTDIRRGYDVLIEQDCDFAFSVTTFDYPVQRAIRLNDAGRIEMLYPEFYKSRSQDLEEAWHDAGQFYWGRADAWLTSEAMFTASASPVKLPRSRTQDIDTPEDWVQAEMMFRLLQLDRAT